jgi:hypothetical protein
MGVARGKVVARKKVVLVGVVVVTPAGTVRVLVQIAPPRPAVIQVQQERAYKSFVFSLSFVGFKVSSFREVRQQINKHGKK